MPRKFFVIVALAALVALSGCQQSANTNTSAAARPGSVGNTASTTVASSAVVEADIKKLVTETAAALSKNDITTLERMYGENYMLVNLDGSVQTKAERLASFRSGDTKFESFTYDEINVRTNPEGTGAVVIARANAIGTNKGRSVASQVRVTQVWSKMSDGWKQVSGHATDIAGTTPSSSGTTKDAAPSTNINR